MIMVNAIMAVLNISVTQCLKSTQKGNIGPKMNFKSGKNGFDL